MLELLEVPEVLEVLEVTLSFYLGPYDFGGILTNTNRDVVNGDTVQKRNQAQKEMHWWGLSRVWSWREGAVVDTHLLCCSLHPGDLFPFTRKPLFIVVDSSNSTAYKVGRKQQV